MKINLNVFSCLPAMDPFQYFCHIVRELEKADKLPVNLATESYIRTINRQFSELCYDHEWLLPKKNGTKYYIPAFSICKKSVWKISREFVLNANTQIFYGSSGINYKEVAKLIDKNNTI